MSTSLHLRNSCQHFYCLWLAKKFFGDQSFWVEKWFHSLSLLYDLTLTKTVILCAECI
ncbi:hypothetical protein B4U80_00536 [Leptotrombidium deliense]|uniref:Uncharacterized protein n=1 Tax=Leptotrombidium deliense TaxID=299467 RepID=A0A443RXA8_9ACAR|nr:hypothetical protein B4U80_00536 [Leptotrombidium deliense]